jgi:DNA-binding CsgD family transcriptional regulator
VLSNQLQMAFLLEKLKSDPANLVETSCSVFHDLGFPASTLIHVADRLGVITPRPLLGSEMPSEWREVYARKGHVQYDPVIRRALSGFEPFTLTEVEAGCRVLRGQEYCRDIRRYFAHEMLFCPVVGGSGSTLLLVLVGDERVVVDQECRVAAHALANAYAMLAQRLLSPLDLSASNPPLLSKRELQCIYWVFRGKTDTQISEILKISASTVHHHVERAKQKLDVRSRVDLAFRAAELAFLVDPSALEPGG